MLGDKIKIHARLIGELQDFEMSFVQIDVGARRIVVLLHVIEESEFHDCFTFTLARSFLFESRAAGSCRTFFQARAFLLRLSPRRENR